MRKFILIVLAFALFAAVFPAFGQEEAVLPACTPEELETTSVEVGTFAEGYQAIADVAAAGDAAALTASTLGYEELANLYWTEVFPSLPGCLEAVNLGYNLGVLLDETVISVGLARLALYEVENGDAELAQYYAEYAEQRATELAEQTTVYFGAINETGQVPESLLTANLPACTEADAEAEIYVDVDESIAVYEELGAVAVDADAETLSAAISGYAELSSIYWSEIFPNLPACAEAVDFGFNLGLVYDDSLIALTLARLALYESEFGDAATAEALASAAEGRTLILEDLVAYVFPEA